MKVDGVHTRSIWLEDDGRTVGIIDQLLLPFACASARLRTVAEAAHAIAEMRVRGAPLIGATAAWGMALAADADPSTHALENAAARLVATRPTAINLRWAVQRVQRALAGVDEAQRARAAYACAAAIADEDVRINERIGEHGVKLIRDIAGRNTHRPVQILTHCNAGWLATVDWGTATSPIYRATREGIPVHVWVDETRPRLQGALTAWELAHENVPHTVIADNAGGHLLRRGDVDIVITGTDRVTARGDVTNKIGTYLKALAAHDNGVPFYVAAPTPSIDWEMKGDAGAVPIEERAARELSHVRGRTGNGSIVEVEILPTARALNIAFDITPARLVSGLITEHGIVDADPHALARLARTISSAYAPALPDTSAGPPQRSANRS